MALPATVQFAILGGIILVGFIIAKHTHVDAKLRALPTWLQFIVGGVAGSPLFTLNQGFVLEGVLDPYIVAIAISLTLWFVLPLLFYRAVETEPRQQDSAC
jgi:hypothetical protein